MRDFDLVFDDGRVEPLEITIHADRAVVQTGDRLERYDERAPELSLAWSVPVEGSVQNPSGGFDPVDVRALRKALVPIVRSFEEAGIDRFEIHALFGDPRFRETALRLMALGIHFGGAYTPLDGVGRLELHRGRGGVIAPELVTQAVEREAARPDNQAKLAAVPGAKHRHLFVIHTVESRSLEVHALIDLREGRETRLPPIPSLSASITTVWAGTPAGGLYVTPPGDWEIYSPPPGLWDAPDAYLLAG